MASSYSASLSSLGTISRSPYQEKKAPPDHRFLGDCPIVPPPATLCRYCQNRLNIVRSRLLLFWTICVYQVCYAPAMRIYLRLSAGVSRGDSTFLTKTALLQLRDSVHSGPGRVKRFRSSNDPRIPCFGLL